MCDAALVFSEEIATQRKREKKKERKREITRSSSRKASSDAGSGEAGTLKAKRRTDEKQRSQRKKKTTQKKKKMRKGVFHVRDSPARESRDSKKRRPAEKRLDANLHPAALTKEWVSSPLFLPSSSRRFSIRRRFGPILFRSHLTSRERPHERSRRESPSVVLSSPPEGSTKVPFNAPDSGAALP